jgi:ABC transport system ATP-binding/permease protein
MGSLRITADGHEVVAEGDRALVVGRDATADLLCADTRVSRRHILVRSDEEGWLVEDSGSTNGTYRNGQRVSLLRLTGSTRVLLGDPATGVPVDFEPVPEPATDASRTEARATPETAAHGVATAAHNASPLQIRAGGREFTLSGDDAFTVGRARACALQLDDGRVSRLHATIRRDQQGWLVEDAGSTNGTFVDGERIQQWRITATSLIRLGDRADGPSIELAPLALPVPAVAGEDHRASDVVATTAGGQEADSDLGRITVVHQLMRAVRIGRSTDNDIVVNDLQASRHHAELRGDSTRGWEIVDLSSHNGTFVNGQRINSAPLADGDIVTIGRQLFRLAGGALEEYTDSGEVSFVVEGITERTSEGKVLLDGVNFVLNRCSFLAVVGTSGAGKSTLLNALTGFKPAQQGRVLFGGRDLYAWYDQMRQRIGYVPQDDILHTQLTVRRALSFAAELRFPPDVAAAERASRVDEVMAELGLTARADLAISKLSGGQRKRTSIALELLTKPDLLFLDEPTSGLDPGFEKSVMTLLRQLADGGRTVIIITHSLQSLTLCDRVLFLAPGGRVAFFGPPADALPYFGRDDFADVFSDLESQHDHDWKGHFEQSPLSARFTRPTAVQSRLTARETPAAGPGPPHPRHSWWRQVSTLVRRYVTVIASDRVNRILLLVQAPLLALLFLPALSPGAFDLKPTSLRDGQVALTLLVTGITFLGAGNAIREIVKEFPIYRRERSVGLSISAYITSKVAVLAAVTIFQAIVLVLVAAVRLGGPGHPAALFGPVRMELIVDIALTGLCGMGLGLLVSALVQHTDKAMSLLPLLLVPQQVLSNPFLAIDTKPVLSQIAPAASAQWGYSMSAATVDMNGITNLANAVPGAPKAETHVRWNHDARTWLIDGGWLVGLFVLTLAATALALRRRDPNLLGSAAPRAPAAQPEAVAVRA